MDPAPLRHGRMRAFVLLPEAVAALGLGVWLFVDAWFGARVAHGRTGDVIGPPDAWIDGAAKLLGTGAGLSSAALGLAGLLAGVRCLSGTRGRLVAMTFAAFLLPWLLVAGWALLRAFGSHDGLRAWLALSVAALAIGLLHVPLARTS